MTSEMHYFHPSLANPEKCGKCEMGMHKDALLVGAAPPPISQLDADRLIMNVKPSIEPIKEGIKHDVGKLPFHLLPMVPLEAVTQVLQHGAKKYGDRNWEKGIAWSRVFRATLHHLFAWWKGEDLDPDSGHSHLAHAACNVLFLLEYQQTHSELDDRPAAGLGKTFKQSFTKP